MAVMPRSNIAGWLDGQLAKSTQQNDRQAKELQEITHLKAADCEP